MVLAGSDLVARPVTGVQLFKRERCALNGCFAWHLSLRRDLPSVMLEASERVVLRSQVSELLSLQRDKSLSRVD